MATKQGNLHLEIAHFNAIKEYLPGWEHMHHLTIQELLSLGLIEVSTAFETAIANASGTQVISQDWADLSCGSDAKLSTVRTCSYGTSYSAPVTGIHNKTGDLLVQVYERKCEKYYYFRIPYNTYCNIPKSSNIEIPFALNGTPRRNNNKKHNPWDHEYDSFLNMCKTTATPIQSKLSKFAELFELAA
jgi:hypothetical protein|tara:strand:+ start:83 stop:646 length:564 start_codon:yes stop_codon:yes gene_type:complete